MHWDKKKSTYKIDELEVTLPEGYSGYLRMSDGAINTSFSKEGNTPGSQLLITITDLNNNESGNGITDEIFMLVTDDVTGLLFAKLGFTSSPCTEYKF